MNKSEKITKKIIHILKEDISISTIVSDHFHKYQIDFSGNGKTITTENSVDNHVHQIIEHVMQDVGGHTHGL